MQDNNELTPAHRELESALASLTAAETSIDRDRLMFKAGCASARRASRRWASLAAILVIMLGASLLIRPEIPTADNIAAIPTDTVWTASSDRYVSTSLAYLELRDRVLEHGLDALPDSDGAAAADEQPLTLESLLAESEGS